MAPCDRAGPRVERQLLVLALVGLGFLLACAPPPHVPRYRPTPAPPFTIPDTMTLAFVDSVARYVDSIVYWDSAGYDPPRERRGLDFDALPGAGDRQLLHPPPCPPCDIHGADVEIQPEKGSYAVAQADLVRGRVIARLINHSSTRGDRRYALEPGGTVYWWVDRVNPATPRQGRSIFIRVRPTKGFVVGEVALDDHSQRVWWQGVAGWYWGSTEVAWASCSDKGCCTSSGGALRE